MPWFIGEIKIINSFNITNPIVLISTQITSIPNATDESQQQKQPEPRS